MSHAIGPNGVTCSDTFTIFVEQAISVLRLLVDRAHSSEAKESLHIEMGDIMLTLAQYIHRLGRDDASLRIKIRYCQLVELALQKTAVVMSNDSRLRNSLLEWMSDWTSDSRVRLSILPSRLVLTRYRILKDTSSVSTERAKSSESSIKLVSEPWSVSRRVWY